MRAKKGNTDNNIISWLSASKVKGLPSFYFDMPGDNPPKKMYKYTSFKRAFDILTSNKIYFANLSELNDPFEGLITLDFSTDEKTRISLEQINKIAHIFKINFPKVKKLQQAFVNDPVMKHKFTHSVANEFREKSRLGVCCLTDTYQSLPMWSHYADNHTGCCLMFDFSNYSNQDRNKRFPFHNMEKIKYQKNLPMNNFLLPRAYYKSCEWEYEHEWRAVMFDEDIPPIKESNGAGLYSLNGFLSKIILGHNMEDAYKKVIKAAARQRNISVQQASPKLYKYGMRST